MLLLVTFRVKAAAWVFHASYSYECVPLARHMHSSLLGRLTKAAPKVEPSDPSRYGGHIEHCGIDSNRPWLLEQCGSKCVMPPSSSKIHVAPSYSSVHWSHR